MLLVLLVLAVELDLLLLVLMLVLVLEPLLPPLLMPPLMFAPFFAACSDASGGTAFDTLASIGPAGSTTRSIASRYGSRSQSTE